MTTVSCREKPCPFPVEPGQSLCGHHLRMFSYALEKDEEEDELSDTRYEAVIEEARSHLPLHGKSCPSVRPVWDVSSWKKRTKRRDSRKRSHDYGERGLTKTLRFKDGVTTAASREASVGCLSAKNVAKKASAMRRNSAQGG